jgi:hypothetical protein
MIHKVNGLLGDGMAPAVVAENAVGNGDRAPALQIDNLLPPTSWPLAIPHIPLILQW